MKHSFFQAPKFLSFSSFGLSISQTSVRVAKMSKEKSGLVPVVMEEVRIQKTCTFFDNPTEYIECPHLKNTLVFLRKKHKIKFVQLAIPEEHTYVFGITLPSTDVDMVEDFVINNIDQNIPLSANEVFFDYKIIKDKQTSTTLPIIVTAIPKIIIEKYTQIVTSAGMFVTTCEPETHAIARCVIKHQDKNPYIIINVEEYGTNISVVEDGFVQYTQTLPIYTQDIKDGLSLSSSQILKENINKVIIYWFTSKDNNVGYSKIENIILTGDGVDTSDIVNFLESNLFVNVTCANVWKNCFDLHTYIPSITKSESLKYATCIGLSMFKIK